MERIEELKALAEKVEDGTSVKYSAVRKGPDPWSVIAPHCKKASDAYHGSLDAAKALHEAVLPDRLYNVGWSTGQAAIVASIWSPKSEWIEICVCLDSPARAWLLAIILALIAQEANATNQTP